MEELFAGDDDALRDELLRELLYHRIIIVNAIIDSCTLEDVSLQIIKFNMEDKDIPKDKRKPIRLFLQSPGGNVISGFNLVDIIESSETPVYTICFANCSSMAFHIFISGHKRFAFKNSVLLNHDGDLSLSNSSSKVKDTMKFFETLDERIKNHIITHTNISEEFYDSIYEKEYYMYANEEGKRLGCVDFIIGEDVSIDAILP